MPRALSRRLGALLALSSFAYFLKANHAQTAPAPMTNGIGFSLLLINTEIIGSSVKSANNNHSTLMKLLTAASACPLVERSPAVSSTKLSV